jgi:antitoxin CptB
MPTGTTRSSEGLEMRRRRALYRAWHRGTRELDLLLGRFADHFIEELDERELGDFEQLLDASEPELTAWILEGTPVPDRYDTDLFAKLHTFLHLPNRKPSS